MFSNMYMCILKVFFLLILYVVILENVGKEIY